MGIATAEIASTTRNVFRRPRASDNQPDRIRPETFPMAPTARVIVASATPGIPWRRAKGTSWLMIKSPAEDPSPKPSHIRKNEGVRKISLGVNSKLEDATREAGAVADWVCRYSCGGSC